MTDKIKLIRCNNKQMYVTTPQFNKLLEAEIPCEVLGVKEV